MPSPDTYAAKGVVFLYKLIIADDEPAVLKHLTKIIDWEKNGFEIGGVFTDGSDVIKHINNNQTDVILSDIKMINVSGLEIAKYVYENYPNIRVILFSGYKDFDYALDALKYNVENYLLKPLKVSELSEIFRLLKSKLDVEKSDLLLKDYILRDILTKFKDGIFTDADNLNKNLKAFKINIDIQKPLAVVKIKLSKPFSCADENIRHHIFQNMSYIDSDNISTYFLQGSDLDAEYLLTSDYAEYDEYKNVSGKILTNINEFIKIDAKIESFKYIQKGAYLLGNPLEKNSHAGINREKLSALEVQLISAVNSGNAESVSDILTAIFEYLSPFSIKNLTAYIVELTESAKEHLPDTLSSINTDSFKTQLNALTQLEDVKKVSFEFILSMTENANSQNDLSRKSVILWARDYIEKHCTEELTLEKVASLVYLAPTYFSKLFKNIIGLNYIDFLIACRMNTAKQLLITTNLKVFEISVRVGYTNTSFFNRMFKANCGMTPTEYRIKFAERQY